MQPMRAEQDCLARHYESMPSAEAVFMSLNEYMLQQHAKMQELRSTLRLGHVTLGVNSILHG